MPCKLEVTAEFFKSFFFCVCVKPEVQKKAFSLNSNIFVLKK